MFSPDRPSLFDDLAFCDKGRFFRRGPVGPYHNLVSLGDEWLSLFPVAVDFSK